MRISDWSSDVCSSDLFLTGNGVGARLGRAEKLAAVDHIGDCEANLAVAVEESDASVQPRDSRRIVLDFHCREHCRGLGLLKCRIAECEPEKCAGPKIKIAKIGLGEDRLAKSLLVPAIDNALTRQRSEEHTSELQSLMRISYAVFR